METVRIREDILLQRLYEAEQFAYQYHAMLQSAIAHAEQKQWAQLELLKSLSSEVANQFSDIAKLIAHRTYQR